MKLKKKVLRELSILMFLKSYTVSGRVKKMKETTHSIFIII